MDSLKDTEKTYSFLWRQEDDNLPVREWHYNAMQQVINEPIIRGKIGLDLGSGCGYDTYLMAKDNPSVRIISVDISDGIYKTRKLTRDLANVSTAKCSALCLPFKDSILDFVYSFGVLHHTTDPKKGLWEISRILKKNSPVFLYLYEDHAGNIFKYCAIKAVLLLRFITTKMPHAFIDFLSWLASPFIFIVFSLPAKILYKFKYTRNIARGIPFNFGTGLFSLRGDLYDRFRTPIEFRFGKDELVDMFSECGFSNIKITRLSHSAGWVVWGYKL